MAKNDHLFDGSQRVEEWLVQRDQFLGTLEGRREVVVDDVVCFHQPGIDFLDIGAVVQRNARLGIPGMAQDQLVGRIIGMAMNMQDPRRVDVIKLAQRTRVIEG